MPTNQTANYALNQWVKSDQVQMEDFNADNAKIDAAVKAVADRVTTLEQDRFYIGTYTGNGSSSRIISLPWEPVFMILFTKFGKYDTAAMFLTKSTGGYIIKDAVSRSSSFIPSIQGASLSFPDSEANRQDEYAWYIMFR